MFVVSKVSHDRERDIDAFFSLSRPALYGWVLVFLCIAAGLFGVAVLLLELNALSWMFAIVPATQLTLTALLCRRPAGRGCLWMMGARRSNGTTLAPRTQLRVGVLLTVVGVLAALYF